MSVGLNASAHVSITMQTALQSIETSGEDDTVRYESDGVGWELHDKCNSRKGGGGGPGAGRPVGGGGWCFGVVMMTKGRVIDSFQGVTRSLDGRLAEARVSWVVLERSRDSQGGEKDESDGEEHRPMTPSSVLFLISLEARRSSRSMEMRSYRMRNSMRC